MQSIVRLAIGSVFFLTASFGLTPAQADQTTIDGMGVHMSVNDSSVSIVTPEGSINAPVAAQPQTPQSNLVPTPSQPIVHTQESPAASASYVNAQLSGMDFSNQNLAGADFTNATLSDANFSGANLTGAHFTNVMAAGADFTNAQLVGADFGNAILSNANFTNADLSKANLTNATVDHAIAVNTRFDGAVLVNVNMSLLVRQAPARPAFVDAGAISNALKIDPAHPTVPRKIDLTVNFDFNSDKLTSGGAKQVKEIADALNSSALEKSHIVVEGHTDSVGSVAYNQDLSERRAKRVLQTLVDAYQVSSVDLTAKGFGKTRPIASNDNDLGRAMNRRVTLVNTGL